MAVSRILENVDRVTSDFVLNSYNGFGGYADTLWTLMATAFIALTGYKIIISGNFDTANILAALGKILLILIAVTQWDFFGQAFYNLVIDVPNDMGGVLVSANGLDTVPGTSLAITGDTALGLFWSAGMSVVSKIMLLAQDGWFPSIGMMFMALIVWLGVALLTIAALVLLILAKLAVAIFMATAPLFILFLMFQSTRPFFEGWMRMTVNYALIPLFVYAILSLCLFMTLDPMMTLNSNINNDANTQIWDFIAPLVLIAIVGTAALTQVMQMAAGVAGGFALGTGGLVSRALSPARNAASNTYSRTVGRQSSGQRQIHERRELQYLKQTAPLQRQLAAARARSVSTAAPSRPVPRSSSAITRGSSGTPSGAAGPDA